MLFRSVEPVDEVAGAQHGCTGGHGFGASDSKGTAECREWRREFLEFLVVNCESSVMSY